MAVHTIDWYRTPLEAGTLRELNARSNVYGWLQSGGYLLCLIGTGVLAYLAWRNLTWPWVVAAVLLHGTVGAFTINAVHELVHGTVFRSKALNEGFAALFAFLGWHNHHLFWTSHTEHHKYTLHPPDDLEVVLPIPHSLKGYLKTVFVNPLAMKYFIPLHWRVARGEFRGAWEKQITDALPEGSRRTIVNWSRFVLAGHGAVALVALLTGEWLLVVLVSLLPMYGAWLFALCNNTQHTGLVDNVPDFRLCCRTITLHPIVRFLYWHMNYHIEHHMYAGVPCYKLGRLHRLIRHELPPCPKGLLEAWVQIGHILHRQRAQPDYQYVQPLPGAAGAAEGLSVARSVAAKPAANGDGAAGAVNSRGKPLQRWECSVCGFIYDEALGLPRDGIAAGTAFADLPDDWTCPDCGVAKADFERLERAAATVTGREDHSADTHLDPVYSPVTDLLVLGSGLGGYSLCKEMRALGIDRRIVVLTRDAGEFYSKPMLSNALRAKLSPAKLAQNTAAEMAERHRLDVKPHCLVQRIEPERRRVVTDRGEFRYGDLVLAVGADPIPLPLKGTAASRVHRVNDLKSYADFRAHLAEGARVVIIGAGLIGCEFANDLAAGGIGVAVVDLAPQPLPRLAPAAIGEALKDALGALGVRWHFETSVATVDEGTRGELVCRLTNGDSIEADVVLSAVGLQPRIDLARQAGLAVDRGIVVDRYLRGSDAHIYAIGDCAQVDGVVRPYIHPIFEGARALAHTLAGDERPVDYPVMPVVVKTPACPVVVCPPETDAAGEWFVEGEGRDLTARFKARTDGRLLGFAVSGKAMARKVELTREMAAVRNAPEDPAVGHAGKAALASQAA